MFLLQIQQCQKFVLIIVRHCVSLMEKDSMKMKQAEKKDVELKNIKFCKNKDLNWNVVAPISKVLPSVFFFFFFKACGNFGKRVLWTHFFMFQINLKLMQIR